MAASGVEPVRFTRGRGAGRSAALPTASRLRSRPLDPTTTTTTIMWPWSCWVLLFLCGAAVFFGWLGLRTRSQELGSPPHVPFKVTTGDKRFQAEATHWEMSPPDSCHHQVMAQLHLSEEEKDEEKAAKLRLDLFNCQASAKGHGTKPHTPGMEELRQPALDVTLIASRQHRMAQLMEDIAQQIRNMSSRGATGLREGHRLVLSNLDHVQERARHIYSQIESNLAQQRRIEEAMEKLQRVNRSWGLILVATEGARSWLENHLQRLHAVFYPTGQNPSAISTCIQHGSYFVLLVALLVATPPRAILLPLFLASSVLGKLLGIPALSTLLAVAVAGHWLVVATRRDALEACSVFHRHRLTSTPNREHNVELLEEELDRMEISCLREPSCLEHPPAAAGDAPGFAGRLSSVSGGWRTKLSSCRVMLEPALGARKRWEPKPYSPSQSLANDASPRSPCQGLTKAGQRCRKTATPGQNFCHVHTTPRASCGGSAMDSPSRV